MCIRDRLISLHDTDIEKYKSFWDDIKVFVEYACLRDKKFYDRVKDVVLFKMCIRDRPTTLRDEIKSDVKTSSLTALALAPGVLKTTTPASVQAGMGMLFVPAPALAIAFKLLFI